MESAQYRSLRFTQHLAAEGRPSSIGSVGDAYDNSLMECIIGLCQTECIRAGALVKVLLKTIGDVQYMTMARVEWCSNRCLHFSLGNVPPTEFENTHYVQIVVSRTAAQPV